MADCSSLRPVVSKVRKGKKDTAHETHIVSVLIGERSGGAEGSGSRGLE